MMFKVYVSLVCVIDKILLLLLLRRGRSIIIYLRCIFGFNRLRRFYIERTVHMLAVARSLLRVRTYSLGG